jgi:putative membrane protein
MKIFTSLFILCILFFGVGFSLLNSDTVSVNYYFGQAEASISIVIAVAFVLGALFGIFVGLFLLLKLKYSHFKLQGKARSLQKKLDNANNLAIASAGTD